MILGLEYLGSIKNQSKDSLNNLIGELAGKIKSQSNQNQFQSVQEKLQDFYGFIKTNLVRNQKQIPTNDKMKQMEDMASYYLSKQGKQVRPTMNFLLAQSIFPDTQGDFYLSSQFRKQRIWAAVIENLHVSSLIHDDIVDNAHLRRGLPTAHEKFGSKNATFSANFIIGRSGRMIAQFNNLHMFQIYSRIMDNLISGQYIQATQQNSSGNFDLEDMVKDYMLKTYFKTASLMGHSLRGVSVLSGQNLLVQESSFKFGTNLGIAFQLIDDILDYTSTADQLGKANLSDLKEGNVSGPVFFALQEVKQDNIQTKLIEIIKKKSPSDDDIYFVSEVIKQTTAIERAQLLALFHASRGIDNLKNVISNSNQSKLNGLAAFSGLNHLTMQVIERRQ